MTQPPKNPPSNPSDRRPPPQPQRKPVTIPYSGGVPATPEELASAPPPPPKPPRTMTNLARRRSWTEPKVRFWILITLVLAAIGAWFIYDQVSEFRHERDLIRNGALVTATVLDVNGDSHAKFLPASIYSCEMEFTWQGQQITVEGVPTSLTGYVTHGQPVQMHIDPDRPTEWTDKTEPEPIVQRLIAGTVILPIAIAAGVTTWLLRRRVVRLWTDVEASPYSVVDVGTSALAPLSHTVRCVAFTGRDDTVLTVYLPPRFPKPKTGDVLWLIHPPGKSRTCIPAVPYEAKVED